MRINAKSHIVYALVRG